MKAKASIHTYLDRVYTGSKRYSYIVTYEDKRGGEYIASMPIYETKEEAKIAAELYLAKIHE